MAHRVLFAFAALAITAFLHILAQAQAPHTKFASPVTYDAGPFADSVAFADLRGNGHLDIVVANYCETVDPSGNCTTDGDGFSILLGNGDGTFQASVAHNAGAYGAMSVAVGDVNGDGVQDVVIADYWQTAHQGEFFPGAVSVLLGNGDGTFQPPVVYGSAGDNAYSVALADLRGDGKLDIVVTNMYQESGNDGSVSVLLGNGDGTFQPAVSYTTGAQVAASVATADLNGDGIPDLVVANYGSPIVSVLLGNGDGTVQPAVIYSGGDGYISSVALGELRGNGLVDVIAKNGYVGSGSQSSLDVLLGIGDGTLQKAVGYVAEGVGIPSSPAVGSGVNSVVIADVNGDGILDAISAEPCQKIQHYSECIGNKDVSVLLGKGDGTLESPVAYSSGGFLAWGVVVADVNGDGRPDLIVTNDQVAPSQSEGSVAVLLNETSYASKTALTASPSPAHVNQPVTLTAMINPTPPNGELVTFYNGKTTIGTDTTHDGMASLTTSFAAAKTYTIKATYPGDAFRKKSSGTVKLLVNQ